MEEAKATSDRAYEHIRTVKDRNQSALMQKANVVGVGIGLSDPTSEKDSQLCIVVMVSRKVPIQELPREDVLPAELEGIPIVVQEVGELKAKSGTIDRAGS
jgi:hypothetical protein